jgi:phage shock protein C
MVRRASTRDPSSMNSTTSPSPRSLTRSTTDRKVAGVSGGLGAYLGIDPLLVRIGFVVTALTTGVGLLAYVAMMLLVPSEDEAPAGAAPIPA